MPRNRRKIQATIDNARDDRLVTDAAELARTYETTSDRAPRQIHGCFLATDYHTTAARSHGGP